MADAIGITQSQYSRYESGDTNIPGDMLPKIADFLGVTIDAILGRDDSQNSENEYDSGTVKNNTDTFRCSVKSNHSTFATIPTIPLVWSFRSLPGCESGCLSCSDAVEVTPSLLTRYGTGLVAYTAVGSAMLSTIRPGDILFALPGDDWNDGDIVAIVIDDAESIKRIRHASDGGIDLIADNKAFRSIHISPEELKDQHVAVLARVVKIERDL